jgi:hypothetical protein
MAFDDGIKAAPIAYIGVVSVIVTFLAVLLLQVVYFGQQEERLAADQAAQHAPEELADLTARQLTQLTKREVVDRDRGVVTIGITRAMELVVKELAAGKNPAEVAGPPLPTASPPAAASQPETKSEPSQEKKDASQP